MKIDDFEITSVLECFELLQQLETILTHISGIVNTGTESRQLDFRLSPPKGFLSAASIYLTFAGRFDNMINVDFRCVRSGATE